MNKDFLLKYNKPGPRYTSYPPATFFSTDFQADDYIACVKESNNHEPENISIYLHIPFCPRLCHFCGCNTTIYKSEALVVKYVEALIKEIEMVSSLIDRNRKVTQIHWGGGTPNFIPLYLIEQVMNTLYRLFSFADVKEIAMECNPANLELEDIDKLAAMGFNRLSLGIQDFNDEVLKISNRQKSKHPISELVARMKINNFEGVNFDLIYGLPGQNALNFGESIKKAIELSPDRIVTFSYAHVPWVKEAQKVLEKYGLPEADEKLAMFETAYNQLTAAGYISIGMDHYAKPEDMLAVAMKNKNLHRNFQGYCTKETTGQVYAFGASSISQLYGAYIQNIKNTNDYVSCIESGKLPIERGYTLTEENLIVREVINHLMCNGFLDFAAIAEKFGVSIAQIKELTGFKPERMQEFIDDQLVEIKEDTIKICPEGFLIVRNIAMEFDPLLTNSKAQYSRTV